MKIVAHVFLQYLTFVFLSKSPFHASENACLVRWFGWQLALGKVGSSQSEHGVIVNACHWKKKILVYQAVTKINNYPMASIWRGVHVITPPKSVTRFGVFLDANKSCVLFSQVRLHDLTGSS